LVWEELKKYVQILRGCILLIEWFMISLKQT
jgi:hypothetical protein